MEPTDLSSFGLRSDISDLETATAYTEIELQTQELAESGGSEDLAFVLPSAVVIEAATILRSGGVSTDVKVEIYSDDGGDPSAADSQIQDLFTADSPGLDASSLVTGPRTSTGGISSRPVIALGAGKYWLRVTNDPTFNALGVGAYTVKFKYRLVG